MPFQELPAPPMTPELYRSCQQAVHVRFADGRTLRAGRACLYILQALGYRRLATLLSLPPCLWCVEVGYRLVARQRPARWLFTRE